MDESLEFQGGVVQQDKKEIQKAPISVNREQNLLLDDNRLSFLSIGDNNNVPFSEDLDIKQVVKLKDAGEDENLLDPDEPKYIGFDRKFAGFKNKTESHQIIMIRKKLESYYEIPEHNLRAKYLALKELDKACGDYTFLRFTLLKGKKAKTLKKEVNQLREEVGRRLKTLKDQKTKRQKDTQKDHTNSKAAQKKYDSFVKLGNKTGFGLRFLGGVVGTVRFLVENPIRLALKAVTVPFWAINETIRPIVKATGHRPQRHIKFPGLHSPFTYSDRTVRILRRWFGRESRYKALHNNEGRGSKWYDAFLTDYESDKLSNKALYEEEAMLSELESMGGADDEYADEEEREYMENESRPSLAEDDE